jgi:hypothetical protein
MTSSNEAEMPRECRKKRITCDDFYRNLSCIGVASVACDKCHSRRRRNALDLRNEEKSSEVWSLRHATSRPECPTFVKDLVGVYFGTVGTWPGRNPFMVKHDSSCIANAWDSVLTSASRKEKRKPTLGMLDAQTLKNSRQIATWFIIVGLVSGRNKSRIYTGAFSR